MIAHPLAPARPPSIRERLFSSEPSISFEVFPPRSDDGVLQLERALDDLLAFDPAYVSVTCGAGGSSCGGTVETCRGIVQRGVRVLAHLTCRGHTQAELLARLDRLREAGIEDVLALRGDPPAGTPEVAGELKYAADLVRLIQASGHGLQIGGACYPEVHLESASKDEDLRWVRAKVAAGASFLITQVFFENAFYFDFVERCRRAGIYVPIVPGIMPITTYEQIEKFSRKCGATVPRRLQLQLERYQNAPEAARQAGVDHTIAQCAELIERGAPGIHFFTLNRSELALRILAALPVRATAAAFSPKRAAG